MNDIGPLMILDPTIEAGTVQRHLSPLHKYDGPNFVYLFSGENPLQDTFPEHSASSCQRAFKNDRETKMSG